MVIRPSSLQRTAFSLVELVMVMVLLGILAVIAAPRYAGFLREQRLNAAELRIRCDISMIQRRARYLGTSQTMSFNPATHSYYVSGMADPDRAGATYTVKLDTDPYRVSLISADLGGDAAVTFDGHGTPDTAGSIIIRLGTQIRTISFETSTIPWLIKKTIEPVEMQ